MIETPNFTLLGETTHFPDVVHCETFLARAPTHKWIIPKHRHAQMAQLFEITSGTVLAKIDDATINLSDGDFLYVPAQCVHGFDVAPHTDGKIMSFPQHILASIGPTSNALPSALDRFFSGKVMPQLASLTNTLSETLNTSKMFRQQIAVGLGKVYTRKTKFYWYKNHRSGSRATRSVYRLDAFFSVVAVVWKISRLAERCSCRRGSHCIICRCTKHVGTNG